MKDKQIKEIHALMELPVEKRIFTTSEKKEKLEDRNDISRRKFRNFRTNKYL